MSNQMNVHFINQEKMLAATVGDVFTDDPYETSQPVDDNFDEPLLDFLRESLMWCKKTGTRRPLRGSLRSRPLGPWTTI